MFGSLTNIVVASQSSQSPEVGMGVTQVMWSDRYPATVIRVINEKTIEVQEDEATLVSGDWQSDQQNYTFSPDPNGAKHTLTLRKNGKWHEKGCSMNSSVWVVGRRERYYDPSF